MQVAIYKMKLIKWIEETIGLVFPFSRSEMQKLWAQAIRRDKCSPTAYSTICSRHVTENCYKVRPGASLRLLKEDAVPSIFDFPKHIQRKMTARRQLVRKEPASTQDVNHTGVQLEKSPEAVAENKGIQANLPSLSKTNLRKKIRRLQMTVGRRNKNISTMAQLINELKKKDT
ncbi:THAP domain-containing protein 1-like [Schistocerca serialis cubense]|uniref:THAP domain-containing protein 1-like n=1 Tax=Schistocerca serialis cubense TaxID=2023355 RepID=UPI00214E0820|nr:THAP domain-containing protein 1-like [Schistocerca serialis cubense]